MEWYRPICVGGGETEGEEGVGQPSLYTIGFRNPPDIICMYDGGGPYAGPAASSGCWERETKLRKIVIVKRQNHREGGGKKGEGGRREKIYTRFVDSRFVNSRLID